jgi:hypothetical protein
MRQLDHPAIAFDRQYPYEHRYLTYLAHLLWPVGEVFDPSDPSAWTNAEMLDGPANRFGPLAFRPSSLEPADLRIRLVRHGWAALSEALEAGAGRSLRYYAEKTRGHGLALLTEAGIPAALVNLVRDPRDVVCSILRMDAKRGYYGFGRTEGMTQDDYLVFAIGRMKTNLAGMADADPIHRSIVVRYEDLVGDRAGTLSRLGEFLGLQLAVQPDDLHGVAVEEHATSLDAASSVGRWRDELKAPEIDLFEEMLGAEMERYGYL